MRFIAYGTYIGERSHWIVNAAGYHWAVAIPSSHSHLIALTMSTILTARELTKSYPSGVLFEDVAVHIEERDRIGLIGPNGAGKSTLLKVLAQIEPPDDGEIVRRRGSRIVYVPQADVFEAQATLLSVVVDRIGDESQAHMDAQTRASIMLTKLGFADLDLPVSTLSGGWRKRLSIAAALALEPDLLLLDEPTNHLDLEGVLWLEDFVHQATMAMVFITHDRQFLENTSHRIIELSEAYPGGTFEVRGDYTEFVRRKEAFLDAQQAAQRAIAGKVRRDTAWLEQGIQGRQTRNKTQVADAAQRRAELKATKDRNAAPSKTTVIDFQATNRRTQKLLALHGVSKAVGGKQLFTDLNVVLSPGDRVGLLGVNGSGKSTLLRLMAGDLEPDQGTIKRAADLRIVSFTQHRDSLDPSQTLQEAICPVGDRVEYRGSWVHVTGWAKRFLFEPEQLSNYVGQLSGGEQARVLIANLMLKPADVLLLDEPTNDLDIPSLEVLEQALLEFPGAIVLVTHDRFMLERIATHFLGLHVGGVVKEHQTFGQWLEAFNAAKLRQAVPEARKSATPTPRKSVSTQRRLSYKEKREYERIESDILEAEDAVTRLERAAADPALATDHVQAGAVYHDLSEAQKRVRSLYDRWAELAQIAGDG